MPESQILSHIPPSLGTAAASRMVAVVRRVLLSRKRVWKAGSVWSVPRRVGKSYRRPEGVRRSRVSYACHAARFPLRPLAFCSFARVVVGPTILSISPSLHVSPIPRLPAQAPFWPSLPPFTGNKRTVRWGVETRRVPVALWVPAITCRFPGTLARLRSMPGPCPRARQNANEREKAYAQTVTRNRLSAL